MKFFVDQHCRALLAAAGYTCDYEPESWEDIGGPESGPRLVGYHASEFWTCGNEYVVIEHGQVVEHGTDPYLTYDPGFES